MRARIAVLSKETLAWKVTIGVPGVGVTFGGRGLGPTVGVLGPVVLGVPGLDGVKLGAADVGSTACAVPLVVAVGPFAAERLLPQPATRTMSTTTDGSAR